MRLRTALALSALFHGLCFGLYADDSKPVLNLDFGQEEPVRLIAVGNVVRDQPGPRPPEFPDFEANNTAIQLQGKGSRYEIKDPGPQSPFDFTNGDAITLEAWVKVDKISPGQPLYLIGKGRTNSPHFARNNQNWSLRVIGGSEGLAHLSFLFASAPAPAGGNTWHLWNSAASFPIKSGWHHVAVAYEFGRPETIRGWIDGVATDGDWSGDGATTEAPGVDDDDVWIGSSMNGSAGNSFEGLIDMVAIHRKRFTDQEMAARFRRKDGPQVVLPASKEMPALGGIDRDTVLVQFTEGLPAYERWPSAVETPAETDRWTSGHFLLSRLPRRYDDWGIRSAWKPPVLVRLAADVPLPPGKNRFLVRTRALARLWIDGKLVAETKPSDASSPNGHDLVTPLAEPPHPGLRVKGYHHQEDFGSIDLPPGKELSRVVLELIAGGKNQRTDTGEVCVAIETADGTSFSILPAGARPALPLTDAAVEPVLAAMESTLAARDDRDRRTAAASRDAFWKKRHDLAAAAVQQNPPPRPPRDGHPIDAFLDAKIETALAADSSATTEGESFQKNVLPVLQEACFRCHGDKEKGGLKLNSLEAALRGGESEIPALVPGDPAASELILRLRSDDEDLVMPPTGDPLPEAQIAALEAWIRDGAAWPAPPVSPEKVAKTPLTGDAAFLRRVHLDIVGVPPTADEARAFLDDPSADKRTRLIDRLLADDDRHADHQMAEWLDLLAENPTLINASLNSTGPFRWFLHDALRDGKSIDRLVTELLMMRGDAAYGGSAGFAQAAENDAPFAAKGHIAASAFLGIEMQCARCHDSPYHSTTQRDLYALSAMLSRKTVTVPETSRVPAGFFEKKGRESLIRVTLKPDEPVTPDWPFAAATGVSDGPAIDRLVEDTQDTRERFAALVTSPDNRRFSRVIVNRGNGFWAPASSSPPTIGKDATRAIPSCLTGSRATSSPTAMT
jgi:cytochrome c553